MRKSYGYHLVVRVHGFADRYDSPIVSMELSELPEFVHGFCEGVRSVLCSSHNRPSLTFDVQVYNHVKVNRDGKLCDACDLISMVENA